MGVQPRGDEGVSQVISFLVAGFVFIAAIGLVLLTSQSAGSDREPVAHAGQEAHAESLADLLTGSTGLGWANGADGLARLGLVAGNGSGLDSLHLEALRGALENSDPSNGKVDYEEALASLSMTGQGDFHLRIYPIGLDPVYDAAQSGIKTLYIGDWLTLPSALIQSGSDDQMIAAADAKLGETMYPATAAERAALASLRLDFNDNVFLLPSNPVVLVDRLLDDEPLLQALNATQLEGDVLPDLKAYLDVAIPQRLEHCTAEDGAYDEAAQHPCYDMLVVGSGVLHSALTADAVKSAIRDWVLYDGGTLVVLGSDSQSYQWLQPLFQVGVTTVNGAAFAPDIAHPLLKVPNELDWSFYDNHDQGWDIKSSGSGAHYTDFSHVIVQDGEDVLAVSNDGAFGDGRIILTTYRPREIAQAISPLEASRFFENVVLYTDRDDLYLDYGPAVPGDVAVAAAIRESYLWDDKLGQVPVRIEVHYWER